MNMTSIMIIPKSKREKVAKKNLVEILMAAEEFHAPYSYQNESIYICRKQLQFNCISESENTLITCKEDSMCLVLYVEDVVQSTIVQMFREQCENSPYRKTILEDCYFCTLNPVDEENFYECLMPLTFADANWKMKHVMETLPIGNKEREKQINILLNDLDCVSLTALADELAKSGHLFEAIDKLIDASEMGLLRAQLRLEVIGNKYFRGNHITRIRNGQTH